MICAHFFFRFTILSQEEQLVILEQIVRIKAFSSVNKSSEFDEISCKVSVFLFDKFCIEGLW